MDVQDVVGVEYPLEARVLVLYHREEDVARGLLGVRLVALALELQLHARLPALLHPDRQHLAVHEPNIQENVSGLMYSSRYKWKNLKLK